MSIYALKNLFPSHNTAIEVNFCKKICKFRGLLLDFGENRAFFWKIANISTFYLAFVRASRVHDISANIDPISLKFLGMIL